MRLLRFARNDKSALFGLFTSASSLHRWLLLLNFKDHSFSSGECESNSPMKHKNNNHNVIGAVMVVGGGIAGIQASLDLADLGYYVYLVEKSASIGGVMAQLDKTFPTNDCAI